MVHSFETHIAEVCGIREAVLLYHIDFWITKNKANEKHFYDGRYWTYNSSKAFAKIFPYLTQKVIEKLLAKLIADGYLVKGNFSDNVLDRTSWYSLTDKYYYVKMGKCISPNGEIDFSKWGNEYICITDIINTNNSIDFEKKVSNETYFSQSHVQNEILHDCESENKTDSNLSPKQSENQTTSKKGRQGDLTLFESLPKSNGYTEEFETFWILYRKHNAKHKAKAFEAYGKALKKGATHTQLLEALKKQTEIWGIEKRLSNYTPHCSTWLNSGTYNDDFEAIKQQAIISQQLQQRPQNGYYAKEKKYSEDGYELDEKGHRINPDPTNNFFCPHGFYDNREEYVEFINLFPEGRDILDPEVEKADRIIEQNWLKEKARRREEKKRLSSD